MNLTSGSTSGSTYQTPMVNPYQIMQNQVSQGLYGSSYAPAAGQALQAGSNIFQNTLSGSNQAGGALTGYANQAGNLFGQTGAQNLQSGSANLNKLFSPEYAQQQMDAATVAPQLQYQQNLAGQNANFGGAGNLGSARQAIAGGALAQQNQMQQQAARANMANQIEQNRLTAANSQMTGGQNQLTAGLGQYQAGLGAAGNQMDLLNKYGQFLGGQVPGLQSNFNGTNGMQTTTGTTENKTGFNILPGLSDSRAKENIEYVGEQNGHKIYDFDYRGKPGRYRGVMAQDVKQIDPAAVYVGPTGYLHVNYDRIGISMQKVA